MLRQTCAAFRGAVLSRVRLSPHDLVRLLSRASAACPLAALARSRTALYTQRSFGAATGAYLDKGAVTDRVLSVLKNFNKVDAGKVRAACLRGVAYARKMRAEEGEQAMREMLTKRIEYDAVPTGKELERAGRERRLRALRLRTLRRCTTV